MAAMMTYFGAGSIQTIKAIWTDAPGISTNIKIFNYYTGPQGGNLMPPEAALKTWTGQQAILYGYSKVANVPMLLGTPGAYTDAIVYFTQ